MTTIEIYDGNMVPSIMMGTAGTAGDLTFVSTGSALTLKTTGTAASDNTNAFLGILIDSKVAGSYGAVLTEGVVDLTKLTTANVIETGDKVYADTAALDNKVGTLAGGTAIGVCMKQSASTSPTVSVKLLPFYIAGVGGFNA